MNRFKEQNWNPSLAERRKFALMLSAGTPASGALWFVLVRLGSGHWRWGVPLWIIGLGCPLGLLLAALPQLGRPFYCAWYFLVCVIDTVVTNVLLTLAFWLLFVPFGLAMRLAGRQPIQKGFRPGAKSYWLPAEKTGDPRRYLRQF